MKLKRSYTDNRGWRLCELCHIVKIPKGRQRYCGSHSLADSCSWKMYKARYGKKVDWRPQEIKRARARRVLKLATYILEHGTDFDAMLSEARARLAYKIK